MLIEVKSGCIFIGFEIVVDCGVAQSFERFQEQRNAECILMHIVEVWATAEVFDRTVLPSYLPRKPNGCFVLHNWNVDRAFQRAVIKPAIFTFDVTAKLIVRRFWLRSEEHKSELQSLMRI